MMTVPLHQIDRTGCTEQQRLLTLRQCSPILANKRLQPERRLPGSQSGYSNCPLGLPSRSFLPVFLPSRAGVRLRSRRKTDLPPRHSQMRCTITALFVVFGFQALGFCRDRSGDSQSPTAH